MSAAEAIRRRVRAAGAARTPGLPPGLDSTVSYRDGMYGGNGAHYFGVGRSALRCVEEAIDAADVRSVDRLLDMPCGHGRVLRWLAARFPSAALTASDVDADGVQWCARRFGATPAYSLPDFDQLSFGQEFDVIWCGSLVTHLDEPAIAALLRFFARHLADGGALVLTTHGERAANRMRGAELDYLIEPARMRGALQSFEATGFAYSHYPGTRGYGLSLTSRAWLAERARAAGLDAVHFSPAGWDDHQDVFGLTLGA